MVIMAEMCNAKAPPAAGLRELRIFNYLLNDQPLGG
jgi:hypothetical protein